jgi:release factor glutamine methyltransferase
VTSVRAVVGTLRAAGCVFAEDEAELLISAAGTPAELSAMVERRTSGVPLEHILGWVRFHGLRVAVDPGVFVPRRRTEFLVRQAIALAPPRPVVVELCCGAAPVATALAAALDGAEVHAADLDPIAVACARRNLGAGRVHEGDLYRPLPPTLLARVDLLVVNAPYVPTDAIAMMPPEARLHEPTTALDGGPDGLEVQRRVIAGAPRWLAPQGHLLIETGESQARHTIAAMTEAGLTARAVHDDDRYATVAIGRFITPTPGAPR